jgi:DNA helicase-2/ATP-dependent DNA helicase PcrA
LIKAFYELEGINIEVSSVLSKVSADGQDLLHSWLSEVRQRDMIAEKTRNLLELEIKPLLTSLNYSHFASKLLEWAEHLQSEIQLSDNDNTFNEFKEEREVWDHLVSDVKKKFEGEYVSLYQLLREIDLVSKLLPKPPEAIPCFTIHASKGMEFKHVYLMGLVEEQLPSWEAVKKGNDSIEMQEERRNCFVAITRAQESLTLTYSAKVFGWKKQPSRFLTEMGIEL